MLRSPLNESVVGFYPIIEILAPADPDLLHASFVVRFDSLYISAALIRVLITLGQSLWFIALSKNLCAAYLFPLLVSKKSTVFPSLSTALYRYIHSPFTLI